MRQRLFWRIYLTIIVCLLIVAVTVGTLWRMSGQTYANRWQAGRAHFAESLIPVDDRPPGTVQVAVDRLAKALSGDVAVYGRDGRLIAQAGEPIAFDARDAGTDDDDEPSPKDRRAKRVASVDLSDGRRVLARFWQPRFDSSRRTLGFAVMIAGVVGLAAFPVAARITRRLERMRERVELWGKGNLSTRVDATGKDEVGDVARAFNAAATRVEALVEAQKALLANASHELRSPLARLRMGIELLPERPDAEARASVARDLAEIDALVEELLLASRLDHADGSIGREPTAIDLLGLAAEEAVHVDAAVSGDAVEIKGDATLMRRLVRNLLENARKHGAAPIEITVEAKAPGAVIRVSDAGTGIPPAERERVFEPFYRPAGRTEGAGGWGLGLALVRQIARRHGGDARCEQREGGGTVFVVTIAQDGFRRGPAA